jgi:hypothetical protein
MRSRPLLPYGRRLLALAAAALVLAPAAASAAPSSEALRAERDALDARDASIGGRLAAAESALAGSRARLDQARARHRAALSGLERRLTGIYTTPEPSPVIEVLTGGDLDGAQAGLDLLEALGHRDRSLVESYRAATAELRASEVVVQRRKDRLVEERRLLGVERQLASGRLAGAIRRERAIAQQERASTPATLTSGGGFALPGLGLPVASPTTADAAPTGSTRGLPTSFLENRSLPGDAPVDAATGAVVDSEPAPAGPQATRAYPRIGAVGPAAGAPLDGKLPTFTAVASWYGPGFTRERMAGGEPYDPNAFSTASRTLRLGTLLRIGYGGRVVTVRVNDRGPYVRGRDLELSQAAAAALGLPGVGTVTVQILPGWSAPTTRA